MTLALALKALVAQDAVRLRFVADDGHQLPSFEAGAHVQLTFAGYRRRYSLTSSPSDRSAYEMIVLRARPGRGGSAFLHEQLRVGDAVEVSAPVNGFRLDPVARHHVFIAGGIGLTPFYTMAEALAASGRTFHLHYAARSSARALPVAAFGEHASVYAGPGAREALRLPAVLGSLEPTTAIYGCGPLRLLEDLRRLSHELNRPAGRLRLETFGPAANPQDGPLLLRLSLSGMTIAAVPGTSIVDALLEHGVFVGADCRRGECGTCVVSVEGGVIDHRDACLTSDQRRAVMCTCVSWARSPEVTLGL